MTTKTNYKEIKFKLSEAQAQKLLLGVQQKKPVTLRLTNSNISAGGIPLLLTKNQETKLSDGKTHDIKFSPAQLSKLGKHGGFLPALIAAIPTIATILGGLGAVTGIASNIKDIAKGRGVVSDFVGKIPVLGNLLSPVLKTVGLGLKKTKQRGKGMYLKPQP